MFLEETKFVNTGCYIYACIRKIVNKMYCKCIIYYIFTCKLMPLNVVPYFRHTLVSKSDRGKIRAEHPSLGSRDSWSADKRVLKHQTDKAASKTTDWFCH